MKWIGLAAAALGLCAISGAAQGAVLYTLTVTGTIDSQVEPLGAFFQQQHSPMARFWGLRDISLELPAMVQQARHLGTNPTCN
jgi:hypothetical protein